MHIKIKANACSKLSKFESPQRKRPHLAGQGLFPKLMKARSKLEPPNSCLLKRGLKRKGMELPPLGLDFLERTPQLM